MIKARVAEQHIFLIPKCRQKSVKVWHCNSLPTLRDVKNWTSSAWQWNQEKFFIILPIPTVTDAFLLFTILPFYHTYGIKKILLFLCVNLFSLSRDDAVQTKSQFILGHGVMGILLLTFGFLNIISQKVRMSFGEWQIRQTSTMIILTRPAQKIYIFMFYKKCYHRKQTYKVMTILSITRISIFQKKEFR